MTLAACDTASFDGTQGWTHRATLYDDFRSIATTTALNGRTSDSGHTWAEQNVGGDHWQIYADTASPSLGNIARLAGSNEDTLLVADTGSGDFDVEMLIGVGISSGVGPSGRFLTGWDAPGGYQIYWAGQTGDSATGAIMRKKVNRFGTIIEHVAIASFTDLGSDIGTGDVIRFTGSGSTLTAYRNGIQVATVTDSTFTSHLHGVYTRFTNGAGAYVVNYEPDALPTTVGGLAWTQVTANNAPYPYLNGSGQVRFLPAAATYIREVVDPGSADVEVTATLTSIDTTDGSGGGTGVVVRQAPSDHRSYMVLVEKASTATLVFKLDSAGAATLVTTLNAAANWADGDIIAASVVGDTLTAKRNGATVGTYALDSAYSTFTRHGFGFGTTRGSWDDFSICPASGLWWVGAVHAGG